MAFQINNFIGFESGGLEEIDQVSGAPTASTAQKRTGSYSMLLDDPDEGATINPFVIGSDQGGDYIVGFAFYLVNSGTQYLLEVQDSSNADHLRVAINSSTQLILIDANGSTVGTGSTTLSTGQWYYIELYYQQSATGNATLYLDTDGGGTDSEISVTSQDFDTGTAGLDSYDFDTDTASVSIYIDDFYCASGATSGDDRLGNGAVVSVKGAYQKTDGTAVPQVTVGGRSDNLTSGTFGNASEIVFNDSNQAIYDGAPVGGGIRTNSGSRSGPASAITGTAKLAKWLLRAERGNGGATTHTFFFGKYNGSTDATLSASPSLGAAAANFEYGTDNTTYMPNSTSDYFVWGFLSDGPRDFETNDVACFLLHTESAGEPPSTTYPGWQGAGWW